MGLTQIGEQERAVVLRLGEYNRTAQPGLLVPARYRYDQPRQYHAGTIGTVSRDDVDSG